MRSPSASLVVLLVVMAAAVLPVSDARMITEAPSNDNTYADAQHTRGRKLLSEGMDTACLTQNCALPLAGCLLDSGCVTALLGVQLCKEDVFLTQQVSTCNPVPKPWGPLMIPGMPVVDACVNLAIYSWKENAALGKLTGCAQKFNCLTGVSPAETNCATAAGPEQSWIATALTNTNNGLPGNAWLNNFKLLATQNDSASPTTPRTYTVVMGLNHGWDCFKKQQFSFSYLGTAITSPKVRHTLDLTANMVPPFPNMTALGGAPTAVWNEITFKYNPAGVYTEDVITAGVKESDPWLVLDCSTDAKQIVTDPATGTRANFALVLMAVNVGPIPGIYLKPCNPSITPCIPGGIPGGYILADASLGLTRTQMAAALTRLTAAWTGKYGVDFKPWCKLY